MENFWDLNLNSDTKTSIYKILLNQLVLILTKRLNYFQHSKVFETNLSDFHLLTVTELKMNLEKQKPKIMAYRDYKKFDNFV